MKITQNLNIAGYSFIVEQDAAIILEEYMNALSEACPADGSKNEILEDIESRIAELLIEARGYGEVVTSDMVAYVKMRIGDPSLLKGEEKEDGAFEGGDSGKEAPAEPGMPDTGTRVRRRLYRDMEGKNVGGVCSGLAYYFNTDVALVRIIWTALLIGGLFFWDGTVSWCAAFIYLAACLCIPNARTIAQKCEMRGIPADLTRYSNGCMDSFVRPSAPERRRKSTLLRMICICVGLMLLCSGIGCLVASAVMPVIPSFQSGHLYASISSDISDFLPGNLDLNALLSPTFWWLLFAFLLTLGMGMSYGALKLIFDFNSPSWHPGLIILLLWVLSLIAIVVYAVAWTAGASDVTLVQALPPVGSFAGTLFS